MAIVRCLECGKDISDKATVCPHCGAPVIRKIQRIFNIETVVGYPCDQCQIVNQRFKVLDSNIGFTQAKCCVCGKVVTIDYQQNIVITEDEWEHIIFDLAQGNKINEAIKEVVALTGCSDKDAYDFIAREKAESDRFDEVWGEKFDLPKITPVVRTNIPKCPTCQSPNIKKIGSTSKALNTITWGLLGTKRHKTFYCNNCGYEW